MTSTKHAKKGGEGNAVVDMSLTMCEKEESRQLLLDTEASMGGLVVLMDMDGQDPVIIRKVIKCFWLLAKEEGNRVKLATRLGLLISVKKVSESDRVDSMTQKKARALYKLLSPDEKVRDDIVTRSARRPAQRASTGGGIMHQAPPQKASQPFFLGSSNKRAKLIVLEVEGLDGTTKKMCEEILIAIRGVVSVWFKLNLHRVDVRVQPNVTPEMLCHKIDETKLLSAKQVTKNDDGEEVVLSFSRDPASAQRGPIYFPEEEDEKSAFGTVVLPGDEPAGTGWFSGITNFVSTSLYWS